jgi:hypothetical protein
MVSLPVAFGPMVRQHITSGVHGIENYSPHGDWEAKEMKGLRSEHPFNGTHQ